MAGEETQRRDYSTHRWIDFIWRFRRCADLDVAGASTATVGSTPRIAVSMKRLTKRVEGWG